VFWGLLLFSSDVFVMSPLRFGVASFSSKVSVLSPLRFGVAYFFIEGFCFEPFAVWGCLFFHQMSLF
jgi:hypothetical protein